MIGSTVNSATYAGNGSTSTAYVIPFRYDASSWVKVTVTNALGEIEDLEQVTDYTLAGTGSTANGTFTTTAAISSTSTVTVYREAPGTQTLSLPANTALPAVAVEAQLDRLAMAAADSVTKRALEARLSALLIAAGVNITTESVLALLKLTEGVKYLRLNADGTHSELTQTQLLSDLTPSRILYVNDLSSTFFNGTNIDSAGVIPMTSAQAVVGTKIRCRGFIEVVFQGTAAFVGNPTFGLIFNNFSNSANTTQGTLFVIGQGTCARIGVDLEIELKAGATGKYYVGLSSTHTKNGSIVATGGLGLWGVDGVDADGSAPTIEENIASTNPILVKVVSYGGITNLSICSIVIDLNYEITTP